MSGFDQLIGNRLSQRQKEFKKGIDAEQERRKREDAAIQLRKQTRDEALQKKRMTQVPADSAMATTNESCNSGTMDSRIMALGQMVRSLDLCEQFQATQELRRLLSQQQNPPIQQVVDTGVVPRLVELLRDISRPELQFEAEWVLTNIASGSTDQTRAVVEAGALPLFVQLLQSPHADVQEQAVWAIGNIAGDSANLRDLVLHAGGLHQIVGVLRHRETTSVMRNATWALSNLCRGKPPPPLEAVSPALQTLGQLIDSVDVEVLADACWAIAFLSDGTREHISAVIQAGVVQRLVALLQHSSPLVQTPALRAIGNIAAGDDAQTRVVLQAGVCQPLRFLLAHQKKAIVKEACWVLSNITAGNKDQLQEVIDNGLLPPVIQLAQTADFDIKKEAAWAISNAISGATPQQIDYLVQSGCIPSILDLLGTADVKITSVALDALGNMLACAKKIGFDVNPVAALIEQADGLCKLESLQEDSNEEIYSKTVQILETYFQLEDDHFPPDFNFGVAHDIAQSGFNFTIQ